MQYVRLGSLVYMHWDKVGLATTLGVASRDGNDINQSDVFALVRQHSPDWLRYSSHHFMRLSSVPVPVLYEQSIHGPEIRISRTHPVSTRHVIIPAIAEIAAIIKGK